MNQISIYLTTLISCVLRKKVTKTTMILISTFETTNMTLKTIQSQNSKRRIKNIFLKTPPLFALRGLKSSRLQGKARLSGCQPIPRPALNPLKSLVVEDRVIKFLNLDSVLRYWCRSDLEKHAIFQVRRSNAYFEKSFSNSEVES